jgi:NAD(P)-dependent dehydrogenase (short-subunit alcohol dehydrogenase family)
MSGGLIEKFEERMLQGIPLHRFGNPEDLKGVVIFLASPAAAYVTGVTMVGVQHCDHKFRWRAEGKMGRKAPL